MAHISERRGLLRAFTRGMDVHRATAAEVFGVALDQVSSEQRRYAKVINFGLIYGMSAFGLARNLGIERSAATAYIERYFARYPGVKRYMDETRLAAKARLRGDAVRPPRLTCPEINSPNGPRRARRRAPGDQRADAGHRGRPDQAGDARGAGGLDREAPREDDHAGARRAGVRGARGEVDWARDGAADHGGRRDAGGAALAEVGVGANWDEAHRWGVV